MSHGFDRKIFLRSLFVRRSRSLTALAAVVMATTVATALLNLYSDTQAKLNQEFRGFGANVVMQADRIPSDRLSSALRADETAVPLAFAAATGTNGKPLVIVAADLAALRLMNRYWQTKTLSADPRAAIIGARLFPQDGWQNLTVAGKPLAISAGSIVTTGDADESRLFIPLDQLRSVAPDVAVQTLLLAVPGDAGHIRARIAELRQQFPTVRIGPVRQVVDTQASVLARMRSVLMLSTVLIAAISALSLLASLSASVLERRRDFAVLKALGASQRNVISLFLMEGLAVAVVGAIVGYVLGCAIATLIGYVNFHALVRPRLEVLPWVVAGALVITLLGSLIPLQRLQKIQPAAMLKGE